MTGAPLRSWWSGLARRERFMILAAVSVIAAALLYVAAVEPAWRERARLRRDLPQLQEQAAQVDALRAEALALGAGGGATGVADRAAAEQSLARAGFSGTVRGDGARLEVSVRGAAAQAWFAWLDSYVRESRLRVVRVRVNRTAGSGMVDADAALATGSN